MKLKDFVNAALDRVLLLLLLLSYLLLPLLVSQARSQRGEVGKVNEGRRAPRGLLLLPTAAAAHIHVGSTHAQTLVHERVKTD